jgi:hypothetical protein
MVKNYKIIILLDVLMGVKLGLSHKGNNTD